MIVNNPQTIKPYFASTKDVCHLETLLKNQIRYFKKCSLDISTLIDQCTDDVIEGKRHLSGIKFPLSIIIESLDSITDSVTEPMLVKLSLELKDILYRKFVKSKFTYFEQQYLPPDLDTAASLTRIFSDRREIREEFCDLIERNRYQSGFVPTWCDTDEHERWCSGSMPYHLDVMLNYWLTMNHLGKPVDGKLLLKIVDSCGLKNYWYYPSLYTPYLYTRLIGKSNLILKEKYRRPLEEVLYEWGRSNDYALKSNYCAYSRVQETIKEQKCSPNIDNYLRYYIGKKIDRPLKIRDVELFRRDQKMDWKVPLFWSLRFRNYFSESVNRAIALHCLTGK